MKKQFIMRITLVVLFLTITQLQAQKTITVDLYEQIAYAYEDGKVVFSGRISSGTYGRRTPPGIYTILEKKKKHKSTLWPKPDGGAKMDYLLRLTWDGIAMHLGPVPNHPASHGCVRMQRGFAQKMWKWAHTGMEVTVEGMPPHKVSANRMFPWRYEISWLEGW